MTMNPPNPYYGGEAVDLALDGMVVGIVAFVVGLVVVLLLISAFWLGYRVRRRQGPPPLPSEQPVRPDHFTHLEENVDPSDKFPGRGERLMPYELGGHGEEAYQPPDAPADGAREERSTMGRDGTDETPEGGGATRR